MFEKFARSYRIFTESLAVLKQDKELLIFPLLSGIFSIIAFSMMVGVGWFSGFFTRLMHSGDASFVTNLIGYVASFVWYFISWFIVIFFNVALIHCAKIRLDGGDPTVRDGLSASMQHLGRIATWAAISATVGLILDAVRKKGEDNWVVKILAGLIGAAWSIATFFIIPVMIFENRSIINSIKRSVQIVKKTWGESLVGAGGIGLFTSVLMLPAFLIVILSMIIGKSAVIIIPAIALAVLWLIVVACISSALNSIYITSLYVYATENRVPAGFAPGHVSDAFVRKT